MMKDLLWAERQISPFQILWIAGFATVMVGLIVFHQGQFTFQLTTDILTGLDGL